MTVFTAASDGSQPAPALGGGSKTAAAETVTINNRDQTEPEGGDATTFERLAQEARQPLGIQRGIYHLFSLFRSLVPLPPPLSS